jgi:hypothetical protein
LSFQLFSHICLGLLLLSIPIRYPNHLSSLLLTILVTRSWINIFLIWLFLILSLLVFLLYFLKDLISASVIFISSFKFLSNRVVLGVNRSIDSHFSEICTLHQTSFG